MKILYFIIMLVSAFVIEVGLTLVRSISLQLCCISGLIAFTILTMFFLNVYREKAKRRFILLAVLLGACAIQLPLRMINFRSMLISLPDFAFHLLGILIGYIGYYNRGFTRLVAIGCGCAMGLFMYFEGYSYWVYKLNFGTFTGYSNSKLLIPIVGHDENSRYVNINELNGKIVMLDFWFTKCGVCFGEFPAVQRLYNKYKDNPSFAFYAVNKPIHTDTANQAIYMLQSLNYSFPILIPTNARLPDSLGVLAYPTVMVIDKNKKILFQGSFEGAAALLTKLL